jgi:aspartyl-tRNA(Asn)/glutamyl-tRNA(Gln) amidotransferase subunit B
MTWEVVIGLEIHVQLETRSKMFCACSTRFGDPPNTNVCPVCLGLPGALPSPNEDAVRLAVRSALALDSTVHDVSVFARKHYFYPDLPKGYQISQFDRPLATGGGFEIDVDQGGRRIGIARLHLEEDAGKSVHDRFPHRTAVDFNRCGVPLVEIVTDPDLRSPEEARLFLTGLKRLLSYIEVSDCNMEEGSLRVDANLSVRRRGAPLGTKQEVKNMNSFAAVERALDALRARQVATLEAGEEVALTTYTARTGDLRAMRTKEESHDYRYFPDPDLPPLTLSRFGIEPSAERASLPELPRAKRGRLQRSYGLSAHDADVLTGTKALAEYFEAVIASGAEPKSAANWVMGSVLADANARDGRLRVHPQRLAGLIDLVAHGTVSLQAAKRVFATLGDSDMDPRAAAERLGLMQVGDAEEVGRWIDDVLTAHDEAVERYRGGDNKLFGFFMGEVMKASRGKADPKIAQRLLRQRLG